MSAFLAPCSAGRGPLSDGFLARVFCTPPPWTRSRRRNVGALSSRAPSARAVDAPRNPWRGVPLDARTAALHKHLQQLDGVMDRAAVLSLWDRALRHRRGPDPPLSLHGDLHPGNLLVSDGHLSGVIDFGDLTCGDPATDLSVLWMLPRSTRSRFEAWTGEDPDALKTRARGWALALSLAYLAHSRDDVAMASLGRRTILLRWMNRRRTSHRAVSLPKCQGRNSKLPDPGGVGPLGSLQSRLVHARAKAYQLAPATRFGISPVRCLDM